MQRLREGEWATLTPPNDELLSPPPVACAVVMIEGPEATLLALGELRPPPTRASMLSFLYLGRLVGLKGRVTAGGSPDELRFRVCDGVELPHRAASRLDLEMPLRVSREPPAGTSDECLRDISSGGLRFEPSTRPDIGEQVTVSFALPDAGPPIQASAVVVRHAGADVAAQFTTMGTADGQRIRTFVRTRKLAAAREAALAYSRAAPTVAAGRLSRSLAQLHVVGRRQRTTRAA